MRDRYILLVEDNPDDEALIMRVFRKSGILDNVVVARTGVEALERLLGTGADDLPDLPAVTLLDLKLPLIDGLEVLRRIRAHERTRLMPVVILTSSKEEQDVVAAYSLGANGYVRKPVKFEEFSTAVHTLGLFWLLLNEPPAQPRLNSPTL
ncbi:MAG: response regulator receiver protein [Acidobacteria bacterium]|nr:response regulator receiver protein [Acidobacteriota bacterium]